MEALAEKLKLQIIEHLNLEDLEPDEVGLDDPLFGMGLGLDSIDALELIVFLEKEYGTKIENPEEGKEVFQSINTIAAYISKQQ